MSITTTGSPPNLYPGEYWKFSVTITKNSVTPDISGDVVTCTVKDILSESDANAELQFNADVSTSGASGIAIFERTPAQTSELVAGVHSCDLWWYPTSGEDHPVFVGTISVKTRVSDVPA